MEVKIHLEWREFLKKEFEKGYFASLISFVKNEYKKAQIFPPGAFIFRAFNECPLSNLKVVILGQDPYHTPGVADGLAFSSGKGKPIPPSLQNIFKELSSDLGVSPPTSPDLSSWAKEGVLLLNATLTVRRGAPGSHKGRGWEIFTDNVINLLSSQKENLVFILWGAYASKKEKMIDSNKHLIIKSPHPSPFSAHKGFLGSKPFSKTNQYLLLKKKEPVKWI